MLALKAAMPQLPRTEAAADQVVAVAETDSTNALAARMIADGSLRMSAHTDGVVGVSVVAADRQTAGRGRMGHVWVSQPGRCSTISYVVRLPRAVALDERLNGWLQMISGLATLDAMNRAMGEFGAVPNQPDCLLELKWPNDVFCHGLKLGGLLSELVLLPEAGSRSLVSMNESSNARNASDDGRRDDVASGSTLRWGPVVCRRRIRRRCSCMCPACRSSKCCAMRLRPMKSKALPVGLLRSWLIPKGRPSGCARK